MELKARAAIAAAGVAVGAIAMSGIASWTAAQFGHHPLLGGVDVGGLKIYGPLAVHSWLPHFHSWPEPYLKGLFLSSSSALVSGLFAARTLAKGIGKKVQAPFGAKHWGTMKDAIKAGLVMGKGNAPAESDEILFVGKMGRQLLTITNGLHVMAYGPSGSGKTRSIMSPSLLAWGASALVYAAGKGDVIDHTSGWRATFSDVRILDLGNLKGCRYNPLDEIRLDGVNEVDDALTIAKQFPPRATDDAESSYWNMEGTRLLSAVILHVACVMPKERRNLGEVHRIVQLPAAEMAETLNTCPIEYVREVSASILTREERVRDSVTGTAAAFMFPWASPQIKKLTASSDFRLSDLVAGEKPFTLYLRVPSDKREVWRPVLKIIIAQITRAIMADEKTMPDGRKKRHKLLLALDEFHSFGVHGFGADMAEMRAYGGQCLLATQSPKSLKENYGPHETITANCRVQIHMATGDPETARMISEQVGTATETRASQSVSRTMGQFFGGSRSVNEAEQTRPVMGAGEVRAFDNGKMLLSITGEPVFQVEKLNDFDRHPVFKPRILPAVKNVIPRIADEKDKARQSRISVDDAFSLLDEEPAHA